MTPTEEEQLRHACDVLQANLPSDGQALYSEVRVAIDCLIPFVRARLTAQTTCRAALESEAALRARVVALEAAARRLRVDANRLCDRNLGGSYEADCRRSIAGLDAVLTGLPKEADRG